MIRGAMANAIGLRSTLLWAGIALLIAAAATFRLRMAGLRQLDTRPPGIGRNRSWFSSAH